MIALLVGECFALDQKRLRRVSSSKMHALPLGEKVRKLREDQRISLREFARKAGMSPSFMSEVESGRRYPSRPRLTIIATVLDVPVSDLVDVDPRVTLALLRGMLETDPEWGPVFRRIHAAATDDGLRPAALMNKLAGGN